MLLNVALKVACMAKYSLASLESCGHLCAPVHFHHRSGPFSQGKGHSLQQLHTSFSIYNRPAAGTTEVTCQKPPKPLVMRWCLGLVHSLRNLRNIIRKWSSMVPQSVFDTRRLVTVCNVHSSFVVGVQEHGHNSSLLSSCCGNRAVLALARLPAKLHSCFCCSFNISTKSVTSLYSKDEKHPMTASDVVSSTVNVVFKLQES